MGMAEAAVLCLVTVAAICDLAKHRIPNALVYPGWALGMILGYASAGLSGLASACLGFAVCFFPMFLLFASGSLGGGDVKLMAGVGALLGFPAGLNALISTILVGGFLAALILLWQGRLIPLVRLGLQRVWAVATRSPSPEPRPRHRDAFPFGVAIALGTYMTVASIHLGQQTPANLFPEHFLGM